MPAHGDFASSPFRPEDCLAVSQPPQQLDANTLALAAVVFSTPAGPGGDHSGSHLCSSRSFLGQSDSSNRSATVEVDVAARGSQIAVVSIPKQISSMSEKGLRKAGKEQLLREEELQEKASARQQQEVIAKGLELKKWLHDGRECGSDPLS